MNFSEFMPYDILPNGAIISDHRACVSFCFNLKLPLIYTLENLEFAALIEDFRKFSELLGEEILIHKQDVYFQENYQLQNNSNDFVENSYALHFNERPFLNMNSYLYISKIPSKDSFLVSKEYANFNEDEFLNQIINSSEILKKHNLILEPISYDELISTNSPISKYLNFSDNNQEEIKDIDFSNSKIHVGHKQVNIFTIENLGQFPAEDITYCKYEHGMAVSNLFEFSYKLSCPHIVNSYLYVPNQKMAKTYLDKKLNQLEGFDYKNSNKEAKDEINLIEQKRSTLNVNYAYLHINFMCFDEKSNIIDKKINNAFASSGFKKKENTLSRKLLFKAGLPGNGLMLIDNEKNVNILFSLMLDLEALCFVNWEQNYRDNSTSTNGLKLCDRIYGIPVDVDIFDEPKNKGWIKNQNMIVLAGSGGGKSFFVNTITLSLYRQGAHFFCIDASFSYKLHARMHDGVYLTYDDNERITFNPFYLDWIDTAAAKTIFKEETLYEIDDNENEINIQLNENNKYSNLLEDKIIVIIGILTAVTTNAGESLTRIQETIYRNIIFNYFKDRCLKGLKEQLKFDDFFEFTNSFLPIYLKEKNLLNSFNYHEFLVMLEIFKTGNSMGYLLNSMDDKIKNLDSQRYIVIDVSRIRTNKLLFSIVSILAMDLYNQKIAKLPIQTKKVLAFDEAWQSISSPEMATFMKGQVKVIRKYGGQTFFISQELDDFIGSDIIKDSIINNSAIKVFADMGEFKNKFEPIKKALSISDNNVNKILSLNQNNRQNSKYKEVCILWESRGQVYGVEVPTEIKAIFETDPTEVGNILKKLEKDGLELMATNYANRN